MNNVEKLFQTLQTQTTPYMAPVRPPDVEYTQAEWNNLQDSLVKHDQRSKRVINTWLLVNRVNENFTKPVTIKDFTPEQQEILKDTPKATKNMYNRSTKANKEFIFKSYVQAIVTNDPIQTGNLYNYIKFDWNTTDSYMVAITERLIADGRVNGPINKV